MELATYNQLYNYGMTPKKSNSDSKMSDEEFKMLNLDDDSVKNIKDKKYAKTFIDVEKWQC